MKPKKATLGNRRSAIEYIERSKTGILVDVIVKRIIDIEQQLQPLEAAIAQTKSERQRSSGSQAQQFQPRRVLQQGEATKSALLQLPDLDNLQTAQTVHFSCHGSFNAAEPLNSALVLAGSRVAGETATSKTRYLQLRNGDKFQLEKSLTLSDILTLKFQRCRLVTLSACETGRCDISSTTDEYIGLTSGFLQTGSASIVSSLWAVDDFSTALLMIRFYSNLTNPLYPPVTLALHEAQTWLRTSTLGELIEWTENHPDMNQEHQQIIKEYLESFIGIYDKEEPRFNSPYYWAGFCPVGA